MCSLESKKEKQVQHFFTSCVKKIEEKKSLRLPPNRTDNTTLYQRDVTHDCHQHHTSTGEKKRQAPPSITYRQQSELGQFDSLSTAIVSDHLPLAMIPFCHAATNLTLKYGTIRTHGDLITAKAKSPASSNGAAELVPGEKSPCQLIMPLFYYSRLTEEAGTHLDLQDPESEVKRSPAEACRAG